MKNGNKPINAVLLRQVGDNEFRVASEKDSREGIFLTSELGLTKREYFTSKAMLAVMQETQEMKVKSFLDWIKFLLVTYLHFNFLEVRYVKVKNVYEDASKRAVEYADAILKQLEETKI